MHLGVHISVISSLLCAKNLELRKRRRLFEGEPETSLTARMGKSRVDGQRARSREKSYALSSHRCVHERRLDRAAWYTLGTARKSHEKLAVLETDRPVSGTNRSWRLHAYTRANHWDALSAQYRGRGRERERRAEVKMYAEVDFLTPPIVQNWISRIISGAISQDFCFVNR